jgi:hypothetical protein
MTTARDTRIAARRRLQDAIAVCGLPAHASVAIMAAAESYGKALYVEALERERGQQQNQEEIPCAA